MNSKERNFKGGILLLATLAFFPLVCDATPKVEVYYEAGAGMANRWRVQDRTPGLDLFTVKNDPTGASVSESSGSIQTNSSNGPNGMENSYQLYAYEESYGECESPLVGGSYGNCIWNDRQFEFSFDVRSSGPFVVYVYVQTNDATERSGYNPYKRGTKVLKYTSDNLNMGGAAVDWTTRESAFYIWYYNVWHLGEYGVDYTGASWSGWDGKNYQYGLGAGVADGSWHTVTRNIEDDIHNLAPDAGISGIEKIVVQGNVRMNNVKLDFDNEMWNKYEQFQIDPAWAYDTGWLDGHDFADNPAGKVQCLASSRKIRNCVWANRVWNPCTGIYKDRTSNFTLDASDLPAPVMNNCYLTMFNKYTYDGLTEGVQQEENVFIQLDNGSSIQTFTLDDPGEGPHVVTANEPITLTRGPNTFYTQTAGWCGEGESVGYGRKTRGADAEALHGMDNIALDMFRVRCGPSENALDLNIDANPNPIFQTGADTTLITWNSRNAQSCEPSGGYYNAATFTYDWQNMAGAWSNIPALAGYDPPTSTFSTTAFNIATGPVPPLFTTNPLPYSITYTLKCSDAGNTKSVTKSEKVSVFGPGCWNDPTCANFIWKRVNSRNVSGNHNQYDDPYCHPGWSDASGNCQAAPTNPNGYVQRDQDFDNNVAIDPIRVHYSAGNHDIVFKRREQGATLDKILVTPVAGGITPSGVGGSGIVGNSVWMEAEDAVIFGSQLADGEYEDYTASGYKAISTVFWESGITYVHSGYNTMKFNFNIPVAGDYYIWARVGTKIPSAGINSFWVAPDWRDLDGDSYADERYEYVLFDTNDHGECCHKFDFWAGTEADKGTPAGSNPPAINVGDSITLYWDSGNITSAMAEMNLAGDYDPTWFGIKQTEESPFLPTHVPAPPPNYNNQTLTPPAAGTYIYQLTGIFNGSLKTETKEVTIDVGAVAPPVIDGRCGYACDNTHCEIPTEGFCTPPSTISAAGVVETATGWEWVCEGLNGGLPTNPPCSVERQCGWVER